MSLALQLWILFSSTLPCGFSFWWGYTGPQVKKLWTNSSVFKNVITKIDLERRTTLGNLQKTLVNMITMISYSYLLYMPCALFTAVFFKVILLGASLLVTKANSVHWKGLLIICSPELSCLKILHYLGHFRYRNAVLMF